MSLLGLPLIAADSSVVHVLDDLKRTQVLPSFVLHWSPRSFGALVESSRICCRVGRSIGRMVNHILLRRRSWQE